MFFDDQDIKSSIHSLAVIVATNTVVNGAFREVASGQTRADVLKLVEAELKMLKIKREDLPVKVKLLWEQVEVQPPASA